MKNYRIAIAIANIPIFIVVALYIISSDFRDVVNHGVNQKSKRYVNLNKTSTEGIQTGINVNGVGYTIGK
ncbi:hypothetical protein J2Z44_001800 [Clostridium punense]|uniref:Uncharacterized protein n=1 Tax=Clostridium punense TaxID=1054297 RepID=A0ABS4K2I8_9CLOT|nr:MULTISPECIES: hypothetical protein [Clostridium]EQB89369.1 hypothetical protein M918_20515 [Clostridium sp. BL8]MBP2021999.1 hypothetical protein [Clostridium punense]